MNRNAAFWILVLLGLSASMLPASPVAADNTVVKGTVVSAGAGKLVITDATGKQETYQVTERTMIIVGGKPGKLEELKPGGGVNVTTGKDNQVLVIATFEPIKR